MDAIPLGNNYLRIGALAERSGVSPELLRAWERRYGLVRPVRSDGGFRLYSAEDVGRVQLMKRYLDDGIAASQAAKLAINDASTVLDDLATSYPLLDQLTEALFTSLVKMDEPSAQDAFDRLLSGFRLETVLRSSILPVLRQIGEGWVEGSIDIAQEHFGSSLLRGRLLGLARGWGGLGRPIVMGCLPGEMHDLGLVCFGIVASRRGWSITFLGKDTPVATLQAAAASKEASMVIALGMIPQRFMAAEGELAALAKNAPLFIAGAGASKDIATAIGCTWMAEDPVTAALELV